MAYRNRQKQPTTISSSSHRTTTKGRGNIKRSEGKQEEMLSLYIIVSLKTIQISKYRCEGRGVRGGWVSKRSNDTFPLLSACVASASTKSDSVTSYTQVPHEWLLHQGSKGGTLYLWHTCDGGECGNRNQWEQQHRVLLLAILTPEIQDELNEKNVKKINKKKFWRTWIRA